MTSPPSPGFFGRLAAAFLDPALLKKVFSFGTIGIANAAVDLGIFLLALKYLTASLVIANVLAWAVAVSFSYVMNSFITFAAESGRQLRWKSYLAFAASGILGVITNTSVLLIAAQFVPVVAAKIIAIGGGFVVNFAMSHFVVFRKRPSSALATPGEGGEDR